MIVAAVWLLAGLVRNPATIAPFSNAMLMMVLPLALGVTIAKRYKASWTIYGAGMVTFVAAQILHILFNEWTLNPIMENLGLDPTSGGGNLILFAVILGLSAGVFEETARYITYVRFQKKARAWKDGLMLGAGHGGIEAMAIGAVTMYVFLQMIILRGLNPEALPTLVGADQVDATILFMEAYWNNTWYDNLLGLVERISAMTFHVAASIMVLRAITKEKSLWFFAALGLHTLINATGFYFIQATNVYIAEAAIFGFALLSLGIIFMLKEEEPEIEEGEDLSPPQKPALQPAKITAEKLEDSRYD